MSQNNRSAFLLAVVVSLAGCDASTRNSILDSLNNSSRSQEAVSQDRAELIDGMLPPEGLTRRRFRHVYEATLRVTGRRRQDVSEDIRNFRTYFNGLSLGQLQEIKRVLPEVEANPQLTWPQSED